MNPTHYTISTELLNRILNYLSDQTWKDVQTLIQDIGKDIKPVEGGKEEKKEEKLDG